MTETMIGAVKKTATEAFKWSRGWADRIEQLLIGRYLTELFLPISSGPLYLSRVLSSVCIPRRKQPTARDR